MDIRPEDVKEIKTIGTLNGDEVKLITTHGGLSIFAGKKNRESDKPDILTASSHRAIGIHNIEKQFGSKFQISMFKSENGQTEDDFQDFSSNLSNSLIESGYSLSFISKSDSSFDFIASKYGLEVVKVNGSLKENSVSIDSYTENKAFKSDEIKELTSSIKNSIAQIVGK